MVIWEVPNLKVHILLQTGTDQPPQDYQQGQWAYCFGKDREAYPGTKIPSPGSTEKNFSCSLKELVLKILKVARV